MLTFSPCEIEDEEKLSNSEAVEVEDETDEEDEIIEERLRDIEIVFV
jgi:hypothetical protein